MWRAILVVAITTGVVVASRADAQTGGGTLTIGSRAAAVGETAYVNVLASDVPTPGVGAYAITIRFDSSVIQMTACAVDHNSLCEQPDESTLIISATSTENLAGEWVIAGIIFRCVGSGVSPFTMDISVWGSAIPETVTPGPAIENGTITCRERVTHYGTLEVSSQTLQVGEAGHVTAEGRDVAGLGAWTFDIAYDADVVTVQECNPTPRPADDPGSSLCRLDVAPETIRVTGASATGLLVDQAFANIVFRCERAGRTALSINVEVWANATVGFGPPPPEVIEGSITCVEPATPTSPPVLPVTGHGRTASMNYAWPVALALFGAGAIVLGAAWMRRQP